MPHVEPTRLCSYQAPYSAAVSVCPMLLREVCTFCLPSRFAVLFSKPSSSVSCLTLQCQYHSATYVDALNQCSLYLTGCCLCVCLFFRWRHPLLTSNSYRCELCCHVYRGSVRLLLLFRPPSLTLSSSPVALSSALCVAVCGKELSVRQSFRCVSLPALALKILTLLNAVAVTMFNRGLCY